MSSQLTVLLPTRNRPHNLAGQLRLLAAHDFPVILADSSDPDLAAKVAAVAAGSAKVLSYPPGMNFFDKLANAIATINTPYVMLASDRKVNFPHAIQAARTYLERHEDCVAAQGLVVGFAKHENDVDINRVVFFVPGVGQVDPLQRHYHLMRRYQSWQFSAFRTQPLLIGVMQAQLVSGIAFKEVMFMNAMALQGKIARMPQILSLQTSEQSFNSLRDTDPFYWFLDDSGSLFRHYLLYRRSLARFITESGIPIPLGTDLHQLLDTIHAVWQHHNFDGGTLNYKARLLLGEELSPIPHPHPPLPWRDIEAGDLVRGSGGARRYIWRRTVIEAEPKDEINISPADIFQVESALDRYFLD